MLHQLKARFDDLENCEYTSDSVLLTTKRDVYHPRWLQE